MADIEAFHLGAERLSLPALHRLLAEDRPVHLAPEARQKMAQNRQYLENKIEREEKPIYGINTGFGSLYHYSIEKPELARLQEDLVRSHACGTGERVPEEIARLMLLLKAQNLAQGYSGVRPELVDRLLDYYNRGWTPVIYRQGSLGASGDLAPLAHLALSLLGEGDFYKGQDGQEPAQLRLAAAGLSPLKLQFKEGLALLNGTQFMLAYGCYLSFALRKLCYQADLLAALSLDAFDGRPEPFSDLLMQVRPHAGQVQVAQNIREILADSSLLHRSKEHVQDPYSLRCVPQVHGASRDALQYVYRTLEVELNAATDNPTVFSQADAVLSGGNFHGQPLALALDMMAIATAELASISERRIYLLISGQRGLPAFLVARPGLNSGLMIAQYTAASIVSQNKQYCTPASIDSIISSNGQEDHVSMGANGATKAAEVVENLHTVLAIELLTAAQALDFRTDATSPLLRSLVAAFRQMVPFMAEDRRLYEDIQKARLFLEELQPDWELLYPETEADR